jgi:hypothetical protein
METVGSNANLNILVQWASSQNGGTKRLLVQKDNNPDAVTSPTLQDLGKVDMGDWRNVVEFVRWAQANHPAKHYFINVWDHGSGWHMMSANTRGNQIHLNDISWDEETGNHISTEQLGQAMAESAKVLGHKVDIYGSDACLMAMAEVAHEMSDSVSYFVGSEETEPGAGWPYDKLLGRWKATSTPAEVARALVEEYVKSYQTGGSSSEVTLSAFDLSKTAQLDQAVAAVSSRIARLDAVASKKVASAITSSTSFTYSDYVDLGDFLAQVEAAGLSSETAGDLARARSAVGEFVLANGVTEGFAKAKGVAIWLPSSMDSYRDYATRYSGLQFDRATHWSKAIEHVLQ